MRRRSLAYSVLAALAVGLAWPSMPAARAAVFVVTKTEDSNDDVCDMDCSLREAIRAANAAPGPDTIVVPAGTYVLTIPGTDEDQAATGDLDVTESLTLTGAGAGSTVIDGGSRDRVFHLNSTGVVAEVSGVTIQGGLTPCTPGCDSRIAGGGVYNIAQLALTDSVIQYNTGGPGGGLFNLGILTLTNVSVNYNTAAIGGDGGGLYNAGSATVSGSNLSGNTATSGGIISTGVLTMTHSTVSDNHGSGFAGTGGGIVASGAVLVINSTVSGNTGNGGVVYFGFTPGDTMTIVNSTISGNTGITNNFITIRAGGISHRGGSLILRNTTISGNTTTGSGGGLVVEGGTATLNNVTITNNTADSSNGSGGISGNGGGIFAMPVISVGNSLIAGNIDASNPGTIDPDCSGTLNSLGYNLIGDMTGCAFSAADPTTQTGVDPSLGPLANSGGPTWTHALLADSLAIDAGNPAPPGSGGSACEATDQRGIVRPQGTACDIGAYEYDMRVFLPLVYKMP